MNATKILLALLTILALSTGQILFKISAAQIDFRLDRLIPSLLNQTLIIALVIYGVATFLWLAVLKTTPLSVAYAFTSLAFFLVPILSSVFLHEALKARTFVGAIFIVCGVYISLSA
ncbi:MAG: transporter [Paraburkholderia sp.]|uniref:EamA family transporter n=1 Tax=Paraburkholderia sp. TaxID=1926495 RepID=UPI00121127DA|nr:EamA family transporter [Paraburkholderia sp.]TAM31921.1 MAG: transporter [Paraburkholderia sp.]